MKRKPTLGILGAGKLGTTLGRIFIKAGYPVMISGSKDVEKIALTVEILVPNAIAATKENVTEAADIIILALPLSKMDTIPTTHIKDKIVIDTMNYWWEVDGVNRIPSDPTISSSELVSKTIGSNRVVKAYNHMGYHDLEFETHAKDRKVIALASDDEDAKMIVKQIIEDTGFDPLDLGSLHQGIVLEPGSDLFGANLPRHEFLETLKKYI